MYAVCVAAFVMFQFIVILAIFYSVFLSTVIHSIFLFKGRVNTMRLPNDGCKP